MVSHRLNNVRATLGKNCPAYQRHASTAVCYQSYGHTRLITPQSTMAAGQDSSIIGIYWTWGCCIKAQVFNARKSYRGTRGNNVILYNCRSRLQQAKLNSAAVLSTSLQINKLDQSAGIPLAIPA